MSGIAGPNIIRNGLTLAIDASDANSYSGSGTAWTDVSNNTANITLVNTPSFTSTNPSYFTFNGSTQYGTGSKTNLLPTTAYTKCIWFYINAYADNNLMSSGTGGHFTYMASSTSTKIYCGHANWANFGAYPSTNNISLNTWYNLALTFSTTNGMALYLNGVLDSTYTANKAAHTGDGSTNIATYAGSNLLNGRIAQALCYNRELSASEVLQNFTALRNRFNI